MFISCINRIYETEQDSTYWVQLVPVVEHSKAVLHAADQL
jgi:hypothetical protein